MTKIHFAAALVLLALPACDTVAPVDAPTLDAGGDTGSAIDTGRDIAMPDTGPADPCFAAAAGAAAAATLGCNGPVGGPTRDANEQGGACTMDSCTEPMSDCRADGFCQVGCNPGMAYTSTGGCPSGSRCFPIGMGAGLCFIDCNTAADCPIPGSTCDSEFSCIPPAPVPVDGGMGSDAGVPDDAGTADAGTADAGTADAGTADAGTADAGTDAGPPS